MIRCHRKAVALLLFLLVSGCSNGHDSGHEAQPVIQVDDLVLTLAEFNEFFETVELSPAEGQRDGNNVQEARLRFLLQLLEEMIILRRAEELNVHVSNQELEEAVNSVKGDYMGDGFREVFVKQAISLETWKKRLKRQLAVKRVVQKELLETIIVTPEEITDYYNKHRDNWAPGAGEQIRPFHILLPTEEEANAVLKRLIEGEDFPTLARRFSIAPESKAGGDMGYVGRGDLPKCLEDPVFSLRKNMLSPVIKTPYGYHIFKVTEERAADAPNMDEWIEKAKEHIREEKLEAAYGPWLAKLRSRYRITVNREII